MENNTMPSTDNINSNLEHIPVSYATGATIFSGKPALLELSSLTLRLLLTDASGQATSIVFECPLQDIQSVTRTGSRVGIKVGGKNYNVRFKEPRMGASTGSPARKLIAHFKKTPAKGRDFSTLTSICMIIIVIMLVIRLFT
jgi:hypothetical protein